MSAALLACQSDGRLVALCRAGHDAAFEEIVRRYRRPLLGSRPPMEPDEQRSEAVEGDAWPQSLSRC